MYKTSQGFPGVVPTTMHVPSLQAKANLPKLILLRFRGDVTSFWDSFKSTVHENEAISPINKFNYLNSLLEGPAS